MDREPIYRGLDRCDLCGGTLAAGDGIIGVCRTTA